MANCRSKEKYMNWKIFWLALYNLTTKQFDKDEWDKFYARIFDNENLKMIAYNLMRLSIGCTQPKDIEWWKVIFREFMDFSIKESGGLHSDLLRKAQAIYSKYIDNEVEKIYNHLILEIEAK